MCLILNLKTPQRLLICNFIASLCLIQHIQCVFLFLFIKEGEASFSAIANDCKDVVASDITVPNRDLFSETLNDKRPVFRFETHSTGFELEHVVVGKYICTYDIKFHSFVMCFYRELYSWDLDTPSKGRYHSNDYYPIFNNW